MQDIKVDSKKSDRGVSEDDLQLFFSTLSFVRQKNVDLPSDAHWAILHPDTRAMKVWDSLINFVAVWFFFEVPWNIAFEVTARLGACSRCHAHLTSVCRAHSSCPG